jgi:hypothetical protein
MRHALGWSRARGVRSGSHVRLMHVSIRLHLVHAVVALGVAVAVRRPVRGALVGLRAQRLAVAIECGRTLLRRRRLEPGGLAVHRHGVGGVGTRTAHSRTD